MITNKSYTNQELAEESDKISIFLSEHSNISEDLKLSLEKRQATIAGILMRHWLPDGLERKFIMLIIFIIGIYGIVIGSNLFLILLILPLFSPRIVAYLAIIGIIK